ncbi:hypothetical protein GCM10027048_00540 [Hymenobacter coalescens]
MNPTQESDFTETIKDEALRAGLLLCAFVGFFFWFWGSYSLFLRPIHTKAKIIAVGEQSFDYEFYVPSADQTVSYRREVTIDQAQQLKEKNEIEVVYAANNPDYLAIPSIQRPLPVWAFFGVHLLTLWALVRSIRDLAGIAKQRHQAGRHGTLD